MKKFLGLLLLSLISISAFASSVSYDCFGVQNKNNIQVTKLTIGMSYDGRLNWVELIRVLDGLDGAGKLFRQSSNPFFNERSDLNGVAVDVKERASSETFYSISQGSAFQGKAQVYVSNSIINNKGKGFAYYFRGAHRLNPNEESYFFECKKRSTL
jgi:hypothetical protein